MTKEIKIYSPVDGKVLDLSKVPDEAFASGIIGKGVAIEPTSNTFVAPVDGSVSVFETKHAIMMEADGVELLVHIGIDTVTLKGEGFSVVNSGPSVHAGDVILEADLSTISTKAPSILTPVVVTNVDAIEDIVVESGSVKAGDLLMTVKLK